MFVHVQALKALGDPRRLAIMEMLHAGERCVNDLVSELGIDQSGVSRHLHILAEAGLVVGRRQGQRKMYSVRPDPLHELERWAHRFCRSWDAQMERLEAHITRQGEEKV